MTPEPEQYPFGSPAYEYQRAKGLNKPQDWESPDPNVTQHDLLLAILLSAETIFHELRCIRTALEARGVPPGTTQSQN